jgi:hypothetical protein
MARKIPVMICDIKHILRSEPKFHIVEILEGQGRAIRVDWKIFARGFILTAGFDIRKSEEKLVCV